MYDHESEDKRFSDRMFDEYSTTGQERNVSSNASSTSQSSSIVTDREGRDPGRRWLASRKEKTSARAKTLSELDKYLSSNSGIDIHMDDNDDEFDILACIG